MDFVTFEIAKKLKEKGFDSLCMAYYDKWERLNMSEDLFEFNSKSTGISAPVIAQVLKWLRKEKKIHVCIDICTYGWFYDININVGQADGDFYEYDIVCSKAENFQRYEEAALAGIEYVLDNLI